MEIINKNFSLSSDGNLNFVSLVGVRNLSFDSPLSVLVHYF